jgi:hypothetical protein
MGIKVLSVLALIIYVFCKNTGSRINGYAPTDSHSDVFNSFISKINNNNNNNNKGRGTTSNIDSLNIDQFRVLAKDVGLASRDETINRMFVIMDIDNSLSLSKKEYVQGRVDKDYRNNIILGALVILLVTKVRVQVIFVGLLLFLWNLVIYVLNNVADNL